MKTQVKFLFALLLSVSFVGVVSAADDTARSGSPAATGALETVAAAPSAASGQSGRERSSSVESIAESLTSEEAALIKVSREAKAAAAAAAEARASRPTLLKKAKEYPGATVLAVATLGAAGYYYRDQVRAAGIQAGAVSVATLGAAAGAVAGLYNGAIDGANKGYRSVKS